MGFETTPATVRGRPPDAIRRRRPLALQSLDVLRTWALIGLYDVELHLLPLF